MKNLSKHSQETLERMKANSEAARKRLARLNEEYLVRQQARKLSSAKTGSKCETFGEAVMRIAKQERVMI
jgi:hypothetical protein